MASLANNNNDKSYSLETFIEVHSGQLEAQNIPKKLWSKIYQKLFNNQFDAGICFTFSFDPDLEPHKRYEVLAKEALKKEDDIWLIEHIWLFKSAVDAVMVLKNYPQVMDRMLLLTGYDKDTLLSTSITSSDDNNTSDDNNNEKDEDVSARMADRMIDELQRYAYPLIDSEGNRMHYVMDELGSRVKFAINDDDKPNVKYATIFNQLTNETVTLMWCIENVKDGDVVMRSPQHRMSIVGLKKRAWEVRFEYEKQYDWYCEYNEGSPLRNLILKTALDKTEPVLIVGSGSSTMPMKMSDDGFTNLTASDYVKAIVDRMREKFDKEEYLNKIKWMELDATKISSKISENTIKYIVDKGCLDALLVRDGVDGSHEGKDSWVSEEPDDVKTMLSEISKTLTDKGLYLLTSFGSPHYLCNTLSFESSGLELLNCYQIERTKEQAEKDSRIPGLNPGSEFYFLVFQKTTRVTM